VSEASGVRWLEAEVFLCKVSREAVVTLVEV
jgi:hypothetical protein